MHRATIIQRSILPALVFMLVSLPYPYDATAQQLKKKVFTRRPKVGLVLSGGGAKGIAHIGVLKVIEKTGLKIDYITGTSMGSIVGGLYAVGYKADMLERLVLSLDWDDLLADAVSRRSLAIDEKDEHDRYIGSLQIRKSGIELPMGYKRGQKLTSLLSILTLHVQDIREFDGYPIPFRCIATDIVTGEAVVLGNGYLPDALRASMAIPSIFTPIEIDDRLLVDGGVIRNLPVSDAREMGADFIIAVDVGAPLYKKEELKSVAEIMDQAVSFLGAKSTQKQRLLTDVLIVPDIKSFKSSDFKRGKELIAVGEDAARLILPELNNLAEQQRRFPEEQKEPVRINRVEKYSITGIEIRGLKRVSKSLVLGRLHIRTPSEITTIKLAEAIDRVHASGFFDRVTYRIEPAEEGGVTLIITVEEASGVFLKFGFSYDTDRNAAVLLNTTLRNVAGQGSRISIDARLSELPGIQASYFINTPLQTPGVGFGVKAHYDKYYFYTYNNGETKTYFDYQNAGADILAQTILFNLVGIGIGVQKDLTFIKSKVTFDNPVKQNIEGTNYYAYIVFDTLDRTFYPRSGYQLYGEARYITDDLRMLKNNVSFNNFFKYTARMKGYLPFHKRFVMYLGLSGAFIDAKESFYLHYDIPGGLNLYQRKIPFIYNNYMGGLNYFKKDCLPFNGLHFMQISGKHMLVGDIGFQIEYWKDLFIVLRGTVGRVKDNFRDLFRESNWYIKQYYGLYIPRRQHVKNDIIYGYGLTLGYNSIIGPIELTLMRGSESNKFLFHANIGYRI
ncbi:MAG: patatin-like phospholipase family protein [Spirochaetes bacterium]|nr:patatin-like phospholipase family protein [Spirochaetota bacterium]